MNIILHCDEYTPRHVPCAIRMQVFSTIFSEAGNSVKVLAGKHSLDGGNQSAEEAVYCPTIPLKKKTSFNRMLNQLSFAFMSVLKQRSVGKADIVITSSPPVLIGMFGWFIAKCKGAKLIYDVRDIWPDIAIEMGSFTESSLYYKIFGFIAGFMFKHADIITTVSPGKVKNIQKKLPKEQSEKVWLVENGLDEEFLDQAEDREVIDKYNLNEKFTCVYIGNIGLAQGLTHLIDLAASVSQERFQFLIFGDGVERSVLEERVRLRGLQNVHFEGKVGANTIFSILKNASMTYIPLVNSNLKDSIPTKTYEALGVGCPVLLVAEGDSAELVNECGLGLCLSPDNIDKLPETFDEFCARYDEIILNKDKSKAIILEKHSRQKISKEFEKKMRRDLVCL